MISLLLANKMLMCVKVRWNWVKIHFFRIFFSINWFNRCSRNHTANMNGEYHNDLLWIACVMLVCSCNIYLATSNPNTCRIQSKIREPLWLGHVRNIVRQQIATIYKHIESSNWSIWWGKYWWALCLYVFVYLFLCEQQGT